MSDLYKVLGVAQASDDEQIKVAFRQLAKKCHPDLHGGNKRAEQRFKEISSAYETLRNRERRSMYDLTCAQTRIAARQRFKCAAGTMFASFLLTMSSGLAAGIWLLRDGLL